MLQTPIRPELEKSFVKIRNSSRSISADYIVLMSGEKY